MINMTPTFRLLTVATLIGGSVMLAGCGTSDRTTRTTTIEQTNTRPVDSTTTTTERTTRPDGTSTTTTTERDRQ